jgi:hypothetical protein
MSRPATSADSTRKLEPPGFEEWAAAHRIELDEPEMPEVSDVIAMRPPKRAAKKALPPPAPEPPETVLETEGLLLAIAKILRDAFPDLDPNAPSSKRSADPVAEALAMADAPGAPAPAPCAPELRHWLDQVGDDDTIEPPASGALALLGRVVGRADGLFRRRPPLAVRRTASDGSEIVVDPSRFGAL